MKDNHLTQTFPAPPGTGKGEESRLVAPVSWLWVAVETKHTSPEHRETGGGSGNQESLSVAAMPEALQVHQELPLPCPGLGAAGIKQTSLPGG